MNDWLGNEIAVGDLVLYSSTSTHTGMNLGKITKCERDKIQIRLKHLSSDRSWREGNLVTLQRGTSAFKSVTRYFGKEVT